MLSLSTSRRFGFLTLLLCGTFFLMSLPQGTVVAFANEDIPTRILGKRSRNKRKKKKKWSESPNPSPSPEDDRPSPPAGYPNYPVHAPSSYDGQYRGYSVPSPAKYGPSPYYVSNKYERPSPYHRTYDNGYSHGIHYGSYPDAYHDYSYSRPHHQYSRPSYRDSSPPSYDYSTPSPIYSGKDKYEEPKKTAATMEAMADSYVGLKKIENADLWRTDGGIIKTLPQKNDWLCICGCQAGDRSIGCQSYYLTEGDESKGGPKGVTAQLLEFRPMRKHKYESGYTEDSVGMCKLSDGSYSPLLTGSSSLTVNVPFSSAEYQLAGIPSNAPMKPYRTTTWNAGTFDPHCPGNCHTHAVVATSTAAAIQDRQTGQISSFNLQGFNTALLYEYSAAECGEGHPIAQMKCHNACNVKQPYELGQINMVSKKCGWNEKFKA